MKQFFLRSVLARNFLNFVFPLGVCRICCNNVTYGFPQLCFSCLKKIEKIDEPTCKMCYRKLPVNSTIDTCGECLKEPPSYEKHISSYYYNGAIREIVLSFKVLKRYPFYLLIGKRIAKLVKNKFKDINFHFLTYIPTPYTRRILRGFSPAELIAKKCSKELLIPLKQLLKLNKHPKPQKNLSAKERKENLKGAFRCSENLKGKNVLLVDDIFTTGTTVEEAAKVLKKCGAKVYVATFAMRKKREFDLIEGIED